MNKVSSLIVSESEKIIKSNISVKTDFVSFDYNDLGTIVNKGFFIKALLDLYLNGSDLIPYNDDMVRNIVFYKKDGSTFVLNTLIRFDYLMEIFREMNDEEGVSRKNLFIVVQNGMVDFVSGEFTHDEINVEIIDMDSTNPENIEDLEAAKEEALKHQLLS